MAIFDLFSKRQKILRGEIPEVYTYDNLPQPLRVQIVNIIEDAIGNDRHRDHKDRVKEAYEFIHKAICREYGVFTLGEGTYNETHREAILNFFLKTQEYEKAIDVVEFFFKYVDRIIRKDLQSYQHYVSIKMNPDDAIEELNSRFKEHGIGYQFESSEIIRVDSTYAHSEIVKPTLALIWNKKFKGANDEYLKAHEHYRHGRNKECLAECLKAFESTMKIICKEKGWSFSNNDTSKKLINICFQNNLIPNFTQNQFTSLRNLLESGVPTIRNRLGGHGQGQVPQKVDDEMTRYSLNLTGTNMIFLIEQSRI